MKFDFFNQSGESTKTLFEFIKSGLRVNLKTDKIPYLHIAENKQPYMSCDHRQYYSGNTHCDVTHWF